MTHEFDQPISTENAAVFGKWLPGAAIASIAPGAIPKSVLEVFEYRSKYFISPEDYKELDFHALYVITHQDGSLTFAAWQTKTLNDGPERSVYVVNANDQGEVMGYSELRYSFENPLAYFKNKPFEQWSGTDDGFTHRGLSTKRLLVMNAFSHMLYGLPLHSSTHFVHATDHEGGRIQPQKLLWEKLIRLGLATKYHEDVGQEEGEEQEDYIFDRFVFTGNQEQIAEFLMTQQC